MDEKRSNVAKRLGLYSAHKELSKLEYKVDHLLRDRKTNFEEILDVFIRYEEKCYDHLAKEENIFTPQFMIMMKQEGTSSIKKVMRTDIISAVLGDQERFFFSYSASMLESHSEGKPRARVFAHAVWALSDKFEWHKREKWIKESVSKETFSEIVDLCYH